jgi:hypothetical protein
LLGERRGRGNIEVAHQHRERVPLMVMMGFECFLAAVVQTFANPLSCWLDPA